MPTVIINTLLQRINSLRVINQVQQWKLIPTLSLPCVSTSKHYCGTIRAHLYSLWFPLLLQCNYCAIKLPHAVCECVHMCICLHMCVSVCMCVHVWAYACMSLCVDVWMCLCVHVCAYAYMCMCICVCLCECGCVHICAQISQKLFPHIDDCWWHTQIIHLYMVWETAGKISTFVSTRSRRLCGHWQNTEQKAEFRSILLTFTNNS